MARTPSSQVFTVSQLNQRARQLLEVSFASVRVEGEISNLSRPSSGHWYFTLKDNAAQVRCAMFRSRVAGIRFAVKEGDKVEIRAKVSLYENRGDYQLIVDAMKPAGEGALQLAFEQLKSRLAAEGLFAAGHKQPLPVVRRVALITSPSGAAIHDMLTVLKRRDPAIAVDIYPTQVQGSDASGQIVAAINRANRDQQADVIILGRGGGSLEDLWCFNEEAVARALFASRLPIISAVGHETDVTIADFVADVRAPTPSAAAELISRDQQVQQQRLLQLQQRLQHNWQQRLRYQQHQLHTLFRRLRTPQQQLNSAAQALDQLEIRLHNAWRHQQQQRQQRLQYLHQVLQHQHPSRTLQQYQQQLQQLQQRLHQGMQQQLGQRKQQLGQQLHLLNNLSPLQVLSRGYSLTTSSAGQVLDNAAAATPGSRVHTRLNQGWLECEVIQAHADN